MKKRIGTIGRLPSIATACIISFALLLAATACGGERQARTVDAPTSSTAAVAVPEGAATITSEQELRAFVSASGEGAHGFITQPLELSEHLLVERSSIRLEAAPSAAITIAFPEDESFHWPVVNTMDAITVEADDVTMSGLAIIVPDAGYNAYNVISLGDARRFRFEDGSIIGEVSWDSEGRAMDHTVATGIAVSPKAGGTLISGSVIMDASTAIRVASGSTTITDVVFGSDIVVRYEYGADSDLVMTGCTSIGDDGELGGGRVVFHHSPYGRTVPQSVLEACRTANGDVLFEALE